MIVDGILLFVGTIITCISSLFTRVNIQDFKPSIQPRNPAFSIWFIIFACMIVSGSFLCIITENQILPSIFCLLSLLSCTIWLFVQNKKNAFFILLSALIFSGSSSLIYNLNSVQNDLHDAMILLGPNLLFSWLTIANSVGFVIYLNKFNIQENILMIVPFIMLNIGISIANTVLGSYWGSLMIIFPLLWTALFSQIPNMWIFFTTVAVHLIFILIYKTLTQD